MVILFHHLHNQKTGLQATCALDPVTSSIYWDFHGDRFPDDVDTGPLALQKRK